MWNEAAKHAAAKQVMRPPPHPLKAVEPTAAPLSGKFNQYTLLARLSDAEAQAKQLDNAMVVDEPAKPVAGSSKHPNDMDIVDGEVIILVHLPSVNHNRGVLLLVGEGVRYHISYFKDIYAMHIYLYFRYYI